MRMQLSLPHLLSSGAVLLCGAAAQEPTHISFSVDYHGPANGAPSTGGPPITAGDILMPAAGEPQLANPHLLRPALRISGGQLGLSNYAGCVGQGPGVPCGVEVDALSYGVDYALPQATGQLYRILFSVDEWVVGNGNPGGLGPSVTSEGGQTADASSDVFVTNLKVPGPIDPQFAGWNLAIVDGNGNFSGSGARYPGLGLEEPISIDQGIPDAGGNIDALDMGKVPNLLEDPIYFSLDGDFFDPNEAVFHSGSAIVEGFQCGDVLVSTGSNLSLYAAAGQLGLDRNGEDGSDDLDALILAENGVPGYQPSKTPYDWSSSAADTDMLLFSVRRGSAVIGRPDSLQGLPIEEGDLLVPPPAGSNGNPGILIPGEALGLSTQRSGGSSDDLSGGDARTPSPVRDCQPNGTEDGVDIGSGTSLDLNMNGVPDECELPCIPTTSGACSTSCVCTSGSPCGNDFSSGGCTNSTGKGALLEGSGTSSWGADDLVLTTSDMPANKFGLSFMSLTMGNPATLGDGLRCVGGQIKRLGVNGTGAGGSFSIGPGLVQYTQGTPNPGDDIQVGDTWHFQTWFRDVNSSPCGNGSNLSSAWSVTFTL